MCAYEFVLIATFSCYSLSVVPLNLSYICVCVPVICVIDLILLYSSLYISVLLHAMYDVNRENLATLLFM